MTVRELIGFLSRCNQDADVRIWTQDASGDNLDPIVLDWGMLNLAYQHWDTTDGPFVGIEAPHGRVFQLEEYTG